MLITAQLWAVNLAWISNLTKMRQYSARRHVLWGLRLDGEYLSCQQLQPDAIIFNEMRYIQTWMYQDAPSFGVIYFHLGNNPLHEHSSATELSGNSGQLNYRNFSDSCAISIMANKYLVPGSPQNWGHSMASIKLRSLIIIPSSI